MLTQQLGISLGLATRLKAQQHFSTPLVLHWLHTYAQPQVGDRAWAGGRAGAEHGCTAARPGSQMEPS